MLEHSGICILLSITNMGGVSPQIKKKWPGDRGSIPGGGKGFFSSLCVQTGSGAHPASCTMGTGVLSPGVKARPGRDADHSPHLVPRSWMSRSYTSSPPKRLHDV
jgi:hypothetical protein